ncbi:hypothetical protein BBW68_06240 [Candidatus Erwinia dacicola]|uniref:Putative transposase n=1 Tax=Candidatus Erwinia dacicola TaxID=252393 RepID=A0A1E7Z371_9GAMM|nr:hypothetical protein BBW68_06240 [Candidatus Erwinia dacicola]RAP70074.1 putative transposase [Candidatus Erwinia dacicola]
MELSIKRSSSHAKHQNGEAVTLALKGATFSKSVELHDKVIGHYLNINTISKLESLPSVVKERDGA